MRNQPERCYCGDPECRYCFPFSAERPAEPDEDEIRQQEVDDAAADLRSTIVDIGMGLG